MNGIQKSGLRKSLFKKKKKILAFLKKKKKKRKKSLKAYRESLALATEGIYPYQQISALRLIQIILSEMSWNRNALDFISTNGKWVFSRCHISSASYFPTSRRLHSAQTSDAPLEHAKKFFFFPSLLHFAITNIYILYKWEDYKIYSVHYVRTAIQ